jgi:hypothetical protein
MAASRGFWIFVGVELLLIGALLGSLSATGVDPANAPHGPIEYAVNRYQTLITGVAALLAAFWTTSTVLHQIKTSEQHHAQQRFAALANELDALEGLVEYLDRIETIRRYVISHGRDMFEPPLNLTYRVSMHTSHRVSNAFSDLVGRVSDYNQSDRTAEKLYGGPTDGTSRHSALTIDLTGSAKTLADFARERIAVINAMDPSKA